jgi:hypothetical protein
MQNNCQNASSAKTRRSSKRGTHFGNDIKLLLIAVQISILIYSGTVYLFPIINFELIRTESNKLNYNKSNFEFTSQFGTRYLIQIEPI